MKKRSATIAAQNGIGLMVSYTLFLILGVTPAKAQDGAKVRADEMSKRQAQIETLGSGPVDKTDGGRLKTIEAQIQEDFTHILTLHNQIATAATSDKALDYHFVSDAAAEIKKRASRLQQTLALNNVPSAARPSQVKRVKYKDDQVKDALVALCDQIKSFVTNPVIENPGTVDTVQFARARNDLDYIIELSGSIKKSADRLGKGPR
jgi:hypothetical protein